MDHEGAHLTALLPLPGDAEQQRRFLAALETRTFQDGDVLFREGDPAGPMMLVVSGNVVLSRLTDAAEEMFLAEIGAGQILGEMAMFDAGPRAATAVSRGTSTLAVLGRQDMMDMMVRRDPIARALVRSCAEVVVARLRRTRDLTRLLRDHLAGAPDVEVDVRLDAILNTPEQRLFERARGREG